MNRFDPRVFRLMLIITLAAVALAAGPILGVSNLARASELPAVPAAFAAQCEAEGGCAFFSAARIKELLIRAHKEGYERGLQDGRTKNGSFL